MGWLPAFFFKLLFTCPAGWLQLFNPKSKSSLPGIYVATAQSQVFHGSPMQFSNTLEGAKYYYKKPDIAQNFSNCLLSVSLFYHLRLHSIFVKVLYPVKRIMAVFPGFPGTCHDLGMAYDARFPEFVILPNLIHDSHWRSSVKVIQIEMPATAPCKGLRMRKYLVEQLNFWLPGALAAW